MRFGHPEFLHFLWAVPPLILLLFLGLQRKRKALLRFYRNVDPAHLHRHKVQAGLLLLSSSLLIFASARPQWGAKPESVAERLDVMLALDISTSMLAEDEASLRRLTHAKEIMFSLLEALKDDRVGLLYFAEASFVVCPLTNDSATLREFLEAITAETLTHSGTRIGTAIETATPRLRSNRNDTTGIDADFGGQKVLILFTDGENHGEEAIAAARTATQEGVHIYCVGIGKAVRPVPIPLPQGTATATTPYKRDANGQLVLTALDENQLREIAEAGNGRYYHANTGVAQLTADLARLEKQKFRIRSDGEYQERFQLFVFGALILLICERWLSVTRGSVKRKPLN
ncbi:VWA domain-containing protein [Candidatus Poribacteria bacterium]|nr:VWA domain-containing protein [Candidatus Poribacteria bacterium]MYA57881.1 VWA domain-containing protein [Candidatus Poribacteria bacterium]